MMLVTPAQEGHDSMRESRFYGGESGSGEPVVFTKLVPCRVSHACVLHCIVNDA